MKSHESLDNIVATCKDCIEKMYPMKGKFSEETIAKASHAKFAFTDGTLTEHMWMKIRSVSGGIVFGSLDNQPIAVSNIELGDECFAEVKEVEELMFP